GNDGIVVDAILGADLGDAIGHACPAGYPIDQALRPFEHAVEDALGPTHLPQHVHVEPAIAIGQLVGHARLIDAAADRIGDRLLMALAPCLAVVDLGQQIAIGIEGIRIDAGECSHPATGGPGTRTLAVGYGDTLA